MCRLRQTTSGTATLFELTSSPGGDFRRVAKVVSKRYDRRTKIVVKTLFHAHMLRNIFAMLGADSIIALSSKDGNKVVVLTVAHPQAMDPQKVATTILEAGMDTFPYEIVTGDPVPVDPVPVKKRG